MVARLIDGETSTISMREKSSAREMFFQQLRSTLTASNGLNLQDTLFFAVPLVATKSRNFRKRLKVPELLEIIRCSQGASPKFTLLITLLLVNARGGNPLARVPHLAAGAGGLLGWPKLITTPHPLHRRYIQKPKREKAGPPVHFMPTFQCLIALRKHGSIPRILREGPRPSASCRRCRCSCRRQEGVCVRHEK